MIMNPDNDSAKQKALMAMSLLEAIEVLDFEDDVADFRATLRTSAHGTNEISEWLAIKFKRIFAALNPGLGLTQEFADDGQNLKTDMISYLGAYDDIPADVEVSVFVPKEENEIQVYASNAQLIGKKVVFRSGDGIVAEAAFIADATRVAMKAVAFLTITAAMPIDNIHAWEIVDPE
jgi:hypothetical protein